MVYVAREPFGGESMKTRYKNYGLWVAALALIVDILIYSGAIPISESEAVRVFINRGLEILILLGVISNPTNPDSKGFNL